MWKNTPTSLTLYSVSEASESSGPIRLMRFTSGECQVVERPTLLRKYVRSLTCPSIRSALVTSGSKDMTTKTLSFSKNLLHALHVLPYSHSVMVTHPSRNVRVARWNSLPQSMSFALILHLKINTATYRQLDAKAFRRRMTKEYQCDEEIMVREPARYLRRGPDGSLPLDDFVRRVGKAIENVDTDFMQLYHPKLQGQQELEEDIFFSSQVVEVSDCEDECAIQPDDEVLTPQKRIQLGDPRLHCDEEMPTSDDNSEAGDTQEV